MGELRGKSHPAALSAAIEDARAILRAYGVECPTEAETIARVGVLDRMGAFASPERAILKRVGLLR